MAINYQSLFPQASPAFWATRPLTEDMTDWAYDNVRSLFLLCEAQRQAAKGSLYKHEQEVAGKGAHPYPYGVSSIECKS